MPLIADPFLLCCAFLAQFYIVGPIMMGLWGLSQIVFFRAPTIDEAVGPLLGACSSSPPPSWDTDGRWACSSPTPCRSSGRAAQVPGAGGSSPRS
jgi:hypothetical protein